MKRLCPNCGYFGAMETHVVRGRIEIVCPRCGFKVWVIPKRKLETLFILRD